MIFGSTAPKFISDPLLTPVEVLLDYIVKTKDEPEADIIIHQSVFTGHREFIIKGKHWIYEAKQHLYKYGAGALAYYNILKSYEGAQVRFYRHQDGDFLKDSAGVEVEMFLESIDESYYKTTDYKDLLLLTFKSVNYIDMTKGTI